MESSWNLNSSESEGSDCNLETLFPVVFFSIFREIRVGCLKQVNQLQTACNLGLHHIQEIKNTTKDKHDINLDLRKI